MPEQTFYFVTVNQIYSRGELTEAQMPGVMFHLDSNLPNGKVAFTPSRNTEAQYQRILIDGDFAGRAFFTLDAQFAYLERTLFSVRN